MRIHRLVGLIVSSVLAARFALLASIAVGETPVNRPPPVKDKDGNALVVASTGHVANYDETKVGAYTLPDPLVLQNGRAVRDRQTWFEQRRPELLEFYARFIYGRVPANAPRPRFTIMASQLGVLHGTADARVVRASFGEQAGAPQVDLTVYTPRFAPRKVPLVLQLTFSHAAIPGEENAPAPAPAAAAKVSEFPPIEELMRAGFAYATFQYTQLQPDGSHPGQPEIKAAPPVSAAAVENFEEWGTLAIWAWGASRMLDYFQNDPVIDGSRVALVGHSRLGKVALLAGARDPRFALVFSSCSGEMGASLSRRDFGEVIDNMVDRFPWQFAGNFRRFSGRWNDLPVDAHDLIALNAPHPVLISGGNKDLWADPRGELLALVAAGPVYRLLGKKDLGVLKMPELDRPVISGDLGFIYHEGGHFISAGDWKTFLLFANRQLKN